MWQACYLEFRAMVTGILVSGWHDREIHPLGLKQINVRARNDGFNPYPVKPNYLIDLRNYLVEEIYLMSLLRTKLLDEPSSSWIPFLAGHHASCHPVSIEWNKSMQWCSAMHPLLTACDMERDMSWHDMARCEMPITKWRDDISSPHVAWQSWHVSLLYGCRPPIPRNIGWNLEVP